MLAWKIPLTSRVLVFGKETLALSRKRARRKKSDPISQMQLAAAALEAGEPEEAESACRAALLLLEKLWEDRDRIEESLNRATAAARYLLGCALDDMGRADEARDEWEAAVALDAEGFGKEAQARLDAARN